MASKSPLKGSSGSLNWWSGRAINRWNGVTVSNGRVTGLDLRNRGLNGTIPERLTDLDQLTTLYLAGNSFTGCIPFDLIKVLNNDIASLGLPFCGGQTLPTPQPSPTPVPPVGDPYVVQFNCTQEIVGPGFSLISTSGPSEWPTNGESWARSYRTVWDKDNERTVCLTVEYDHIPGALLHTRWANIMAWAENLSGYDIFRTTKRAITDDGGTIIRGVGAVLGTRGADPESTTVDLIMGIAVSTLDQFGIFISVGEFVDPNLNDRDTLLPSSSVDRLTTLSEGIADRMIRRYGADTSGVQSRHADMDGAFDLAKPK